ncbi:hypothetical protein EVAR_31816_1 [Eumeta japonica]|uniref:Peptidase A2 domain-containing protein n=1 Tax=Eumeta variegata TaxID=151549 RepID=A0A4C1WKT0_EUMVA|nr:hypothetical protein EVAR_31816_1 [Eumeta japonica]
MRLQGKKYIGQSLMAADGCPNAPSRLFVTDRRTKIQFLVDIGSELCVFPRSVVLQRHTRTTYQMRAANGASVNTYGYINLELDLLRYVTSRLSVAICSGRSRQTYI